ncbi:MAG: hypothetical protein M3220_14600, partial [Chloroflexota bacterium]|nr:hypothetical protein [Chloroflexota bacterium]
MASPHGEETGRFGEWLGDLLTSKQREEQTIFYYDHGNQEADPHVAAIKGFVGQTVSNRNRLADIDVMLASPAGKVQLLIEIEERPMSPKKLLGDLLALLLCNQVAVHKHYFRITPHTHLVIAGYFPAGGQGRAKVEEVIQPRLEHF